MIKRFRMVAGPNGSGKTTLVGWLTRDYAVNFYTMLNADRVARRYAQGAFSVLCAPPPFDIMRGMIHPSPDWREVTAANWIEPNCANFALYALSTASEGTNKGTRQ